VVLEAAIFVVVTLIAPWAARRARPDLARRAGPSMPEVAWWARLAYGLLPPYLAWIRGAVTGRDLGLHLGWAQAGGGLAAIAACVLLAELALKRKGGRASTRAWLGRGPSSLGLVDTPRWALYRAAGVVWTGSPPVGTVVGSLMGLAEVILRSGRPLSLSDHEDRAHWIWVAAAFVLLGLTGSLWLTLTAQAGLTWLTRGDPG
jgi:hypothetical protein